MIARFDRRRTRGGAERSKLLDLLETGLEEVDAGRIVRAALGEADGELGAAEANAETGNRRIWVFAIGKAAVPMADAAVEALGSAFAGGMAIAPRGADEPRRCFRVVRAGHPIPDEDGLAAAAELVSTAGRVRKGDTALVLLSGGGSALVPAPPGSIRHWDLAKTTALLLESGAPIESVNVVRRHLSALQGGGLARLLRPAKVVTWILSDVVGSAPESIASGPTVPDPTTFDDAVSILRRHRLWTRIPQSVRDHLVCGMRGEVEETAKPGEAIFDSASVRILGDNETLLDGVCQAAEVGGFDVARIAEPVVGEAREAGRSVARRAIELAASARRRTILVGGGETTVSVRGRGRGGRNQEFALAASLDLDEAPGIWLAAFASDGIDGPTDASGALVDGTTISGGRALGLDPLRSLVENDAYRFLDACGDLLFTGATGTNVADVCLAMVDPARERSASSLRGRT